MRKVALLVALLAPALAHAQFGRDAANEDTPEEQETRQANTELKARTDMTVFFYKETESGTPPIPNTSQASPNGILFTDIRGFVEADHISGGKFDLVGDLRMRLNPDPNAPSRGYLGGDEYDLKEAYTRLNTGKLESSLGRIIIRDVDATTVDGLRLVYRPSQRFEIGTFGGAFPDPFSRSIESDYSIATVGPTGNVEEKFADPIPLVAGAWGGFRTERYYGAIGAGKIFSRDDVMSNPDRTFLTSYGYYRASAQLDVFHTLAADVQGPAGAQIMLGQIGTRYRPNPRLELEAGASRMSTYAVERYVRDLLEVRNPILNQIQNNTEIVRMGTNEVRGGANYLFPKQRVYTFGQLRYREREGLVLPADLATIYADKVIDVSAGIRQKRSIWATDLGLNVIGIRGVRSSSNILLVRASKAFMKSKLQVDSDVSYTQYQDNCPKDPPDPTCPGTSVGQSIRAGATGAYRYDKNWLFITDYHLQQNVASAQRPGALAPTSYPVILGHTFFFRGQYVY